MRSDSAAALSKICCRPSIHAGLSICFGAPLLAQTQTRGDMTGIPKAILQQKERDECQNSGTSDFLIVHSWTGSHWLHKRREERSD